MAILLNCIIIIILLLSSLMDSEAFKNQKEEEDEQMFEEEENQDCYNSVTCQTCGYENDISSQKCGVCEKELYQTYKQSQTVCHLCNKSLPMNIIDSHKTQCQFRRRIQFLRKGQFFPNQSKNLMPQSLKQKKFTPECLYCTEPSILNHAKNCQSYPEMKLQFEPFEDIYEPRYGKVEIKFLQASKLTEKQKTVLLYAYKHSRFYHQKYIENFAPQKRLQQAKIRHHIEKKSPFIIHFSLKDSIENFIQDGFYKNIFQNDLNTQEGKKQKILEKERQDELFHNFYFHADHSERVKYGAINILNNPRGIQHLSKKMGGSYFVLKESVKSRCTFEYTNVHGKRYKLLSTVKNFLHLFGFMDMQELNQILNSIQGLQNKNNFEKLEQNYLELHVHGPVEFSSDIEKMVIDSEELRDERVYYLLEEFSIKYGIKVEII